MKREDTISREQALLALTGVDLTKKTTEEVIALFNERIKALPPITPARKKGKWITNSHFPDNLICSCCNTEFDMWFWEQGDMHFCPNCGAEMEVEE